MTRRLPNRVLVGGVSFAAMEAVSYATHRWLMHGRAMPWHRSHHPPAEHGFEKNDLFPATFAAGAVAVFALAAVKPRLRPLRWAATGVTAYGLSYAGVHEVYIHRRVGVRPPSWRYLRWLEESHRIHHRYAGEPYGMLAPIVPSELRRRAANSSTRARRDRL